MPALKTLRQARGPAAPEMRRGGFKTRPYCRRRVSCCCPSPVYDSASTSVATIVLLLYSAFPLSPT